MKILRTGTWTDRKKRQHRFDENRLQQIANNYKQPLDFSIAPIIATHDAKPTTPKLGKIESLKRVGLFLLAKPVNVRKDMVQVLKDIGYQYVSTSLNPNDTINHLALVPNPAVSGLGEFPEAALNFSQPGEETDTIELLIEFSALEQEESEETETKEKNQQINQKEEQHMFQKKKKPDDDQQQVQDAAAVDSPGEKDENEKQIDFSAALGYEPPEFISQRIFPGIKVPGTPLELKKFGKEMFQQYMSRRAMFAASNVAEMGKPDYLYVRIEPRDQVRRFDKEHEPTNTQPDKVQMTKEAKFGINLDIEIDNATRLFDIDNYPTGHKITLSATDQFSDLTNSQPIEVIDEGKQVVSRKIGKDPNLMVLPKDVFNVIKRHPELEIKSLVGQETAATIERLKERFEIEDIVLGTSLKLNETTNAFEYIWSTDILLLYVNPSPKPSVKEMSFGYRLRQEGYPFVDDDIEGIDKTKIEAIRYNEKCEDVILAAEAAYFINEAIA